MVLRIASFTLLALALTRPLAAEDPDAFAEEPGLTPTAVAAPAIAPAPEPTAAAVPNWISVDFGVANACGSAPLTLAFKAPREGKWQKLELQPRCSVEWRRHAGDGALIREPKSVDATSYEAAWLPGGLALLLLQWSEDDQGQLLLDARILRANGEDQRVKPAIGDGDFYLSPDNKQLWYASVGDGTDPAHDLSLYRLDLAADNGAFKDAETMSQEEFAGLGAAELPVIKPAR